MGEGALITDLLNIVLQLAPMRGGVHPYVTSMMNAAVLIMVIAIALQFFYAVLRRRMTDLGKMRRVMKETTDWRKEYMDAMKKQDKERIDKLKRKQQYMNKLQMEMMQMNFRPMIAFMIPMLILWWAVLPQVFGNTVAVSPISLNFVGDLMPITCTKTMISQDIDSITKELESKVNETKSTGSGVSGDQALALANDAKELAQKANDAKEPVAQKINYLGAREKLLEAYKTLNSGLEKKLPERIPRCNAENEIFLWAWYAIVSIAFSGMVMKVTRTSTDLGI